MDGWDLERELRRMGPELPVVLVTADRLLSIRGSVRDKPFRGLRTTRSAHASVAVCNLVERGWHKRRALQAPVREQGGVGTTTPCARGQSHDNRVQRHNWR